MHQLLAALLLIHAVDLLTSRFRRQPDSTSKGKDDEKKSLTPVLVPAVFGVLGALAGSAVSGWTNYGVADRTAEHQRSSLERQAQHQVDALAKQAEYQNAALERQAQHQVDALAKQAEYQNAALERQGEQQNTAWQRQIVYEQRRAYLTKRYELLERTAKILNQRGAARSLDASISATSRQLAAILLSDPQTGSERIDRLNKEARDEGLKLSEFRAEYAAVMNMSVAYFGLQTKAAVYAIQDKHPFQWWDIEEQLATDLLSAMARELGYSLTDEPTELQPAAPVPGSLGPGPTGASR